MKLVFSDQAWSDYRHWADTDADMLRRLNTLIQACRRDAFKGLGKPEPLKGSLAGWWSRRLTLKDRLVYRLAGAPPDQRLEIAQCRFHY